MSSPPTLYTSVQFHKILQNTLAELLISVLTIKEDEWKTITLSESPHHPNTADVLETGWQLLLT